MRLVIAGGGTGGHLFPGIAIAEELLARPGNHEVLFMGASGGLEERAVPKLGYQIELLPSLKGGLMGFDAVTKTIRLCKGYLQARKSLLEFKADAVVGMGGYASFLPVLASWGVEVPSLIMEQNAIPGRATRKLASVATEVGLEFLEAAEHLPSRTKIRHLGNPLRKGVQIASGPVSEMNRSDRPVSDRPVLLVIGGSQGANFLNDMTVQIWPKVKKLIPGLKVLLLSGPEHAERVRGTFAAAGMRGKVYSFCEQMDELYAQADVVLARAGATTLAEVTACALPSILIPYPYAVDDHQSANAGVLHLAGAAWRLEQSGLEEDRLAQRIADVLLQPARRRRMANAAYKLARPDAAVKVVNRLEILAGIREEDNCGIPEAPYPPPPPASFSSKDSRKDVA